MDRRHGFARDLVRVPVAIGNRAVGPCRWITRGIVRDPNKLFRFAVWTSAMRPRQWPYYTASGRLARTIGPDGPAGESRFRRARAERETLSNDGRPADDGGRTAGRFERCAGPAKPGPREAWRFNARCKNNNNNNTFPLGSDQSQYFHSGHTGPLWRWASYLKTVFTRPVNQYQIGNLNSRSRLAYRGHSGFRHCATTPELSFQ